MPDTRSQIHTLPHSLDFESRERFVRDLISLRVELRQEVDKRRFAERTLVFSLGLNLVFVLGVVLDALL